MIDLRSDTVTTPTKEMRDVMYKAEVGDDVYGEDPTVNELQEYVAHLFGKEAALYVPSGTMSNQLSLKVLTNPGDEIITDADAHIFYYETAGPSILSQIQIKPINSTNAMPDLNEIEVAIRPDIYYFPETKLICIENTHNRHGGMVVDYNYLLDLRKLADKYNLKLHLDGARIWNAHIKTGVSLSDYGKLFDTISVCLSKGLGAPVGSLIVSSNENIKKALKWRKIFGGGMRQAGILAAAGLYALKHNLQLLENDHQNAQYFAKNVKEINGISCNEKNVHTNIVVFELDNSINPTEFVVKCKSKGLLLHWIGANRIRVVFHLQVSFEDAQKALEIIKNCI